MSVQYPKPNLLWLDHVLISGKIFAMVCVVFFVLLDPHHMSAWVGLPLTLVVWGTGAYFARSLYGYLKTLEVGHDSRAKLEAEIVELKTRIKNSEEIHTRTCDDANREHGARRKLEAAAFKAIQLLHSATRFKSTEAQEVTAVLELAMFETLGVDSKLRDEITNMKEGAL